MKERIRFLVKEKKFDGTLFVSNELNKCVEFISKELRNRNKNDGYDEYWHNVDLVIIKETMKTEELLNV